MDEDILKFNKACLIDVIGVFNENLSFITEF